MKPEPGTYALILKGDSTAGVQIGRWGLLDLKPGYYIYVGSAFGPGGVKARVSRHFREKKTRHWHIDYLREAVSPVCAWCSYEPLNQEHHWARLLAEMDNTSGVKGFGCSDCRCDTHLFRMATRPDFGQFSRAAGDVIEAWPR